MARLTTKRQFAIVTAVAEPRKSLSFTGTFSLTRISKTLVFYDSTNNFAVPYSKIYWAMCSDSPLL